MQISKKVMRYCKFCKKHTLHDVSIASSGHKRGALKRGGKARVRKRGKWRGFGNLGRYSKPPITAWKRKTKSTKKTNLIYTCPECKKSTLQRKGTRAGKVMMQKE